MRFRAQLAIDVGVILMGEDAKVPQEGFALRGVVPGASLFVDGVECGELIEAQPITFHRDDPRPSPVELDVWLELPVLQF